MQYDFCKIRKVCRRLPQSNGVKLHLRRRRFYSRTAVADNQFVSFPLLKKFIFFFFSFSPKLNSIESQITTFRRSHQTSNNLMLLSSSNWPILTCTNFNCLRFQLEWINFGPCTFYLFVYQTISIDLFCHPIRCGGVTIKWQCETEF